MNHYEVLGIPATATVAQLRRAYLDAARRHHPDYHLSDDSATRARHARVMQQVNAAWAVLGTAEARDRYDRSLRDLTSQAGSRQASTASAGEREPVVVPPGKGWTPRAADTGWQDDFMAWAEEDERLAPDAPRPRAAKGLVLVLPAGMFAAAVALAFAGMATSSRGLLAFAFAALVGSVGLFALLPMLEMTRNRNRG